MSPTPPIVAESSPLACFAYPGLFNEPQARRIDLDSTGKPERHGVLASKLEGAVLFRIGVGRRQSALRILRVNTELETDPETPYGNAATCTGFDDTYWIILCGPFVHVDRLANSAFNGQPEIPPDADKLTEFGGSSRTGCN